MASIHMTVAGERWRANWRDEHGGQHSKVFETKEEAEGYERAMYHEREARIGAQVCALDECDRLVPQTGKGRRKKYCTDEHALKAKRAAASKKKREHKKKTGIASWPPRPCANPRCDEIVVQTGVGAPKKFHDDACARAFHSRKAAEKRRTGARDHDHILGPVREDGFAECSQCGPVLAYRSVESGGRVRYRCSKKVRQQDSRQRAEDRLDPLIERVRKLASRGVLNFSVDDLRRLEAEADGHCQLCGRETAVLNVDHCHDLSGRVRGFLCSTCNTGLGKFKDDPARLLAAAEYLERST